MISQAFDYTRAQSVAEAVSLLEESGGEAKLLAGGHSLLPMMKVCLTSFEKLIDIGQIAQLKGVQKDGDRLIVGALTTYKEALHDPLVKTHLPVLSEAAAMIGDLQVRNRGTIGGNLAHADPASDLPALALALDAQLTVQGPDGEEQIGADEFFLGPLITALPPNSVLTSVAFQIPPEGAKSTYVKFAHPASGYAVVGVAAALGRAADGTIDFARVGVTGVSDVAFRAEETERRLIGQKPTEAVIQEAAQKAAEGQEMGRDLFASEEYRRHLCTVYTARAIRRLVTETE